MSEPIEVGTVLIPAEAIEMRAVRSAGPGGQNVQKVASKVELRIDLGRIEGMDGGSRERLLQLARSRIDRFGRLFVTSQKTRDQSRNIEDAREKIRDLVERSLKAPKPRVATRPGRAVKERRLQEKKLLGRRKAERRKTSDPEL